MRDQRQPGHQIPAFDPRASPPFALPPPSHPPQVGLGRRDGQVDDDRLGDRAESFHCRRKIEIGLHNDFMIVAGTPRRAGQWVTVFRYLGTAGSYSESRSFEAYSATWVRCFIPSLARMCDT